MRRIGASRGGERGALLFHLPRRGEVARESEREGMKTSSPVH
jgi:hypothetical protein